MEKIQLGRTSLMATRVGFGVLPLQRVEKNEAVRILKAAYQGGINFYDTARAYSDSEEKIGLALNSVRAHVIIATKSNKNTRAEIIKELETSLRTLKTDYIDIYQLHNPSSWPLPQEHDEICAALQRARQEGKIRFVGITNHTRKVAATAVQSDFFDTLQFPFNYLSDAVDLSLIDLCARQNIGLIAMKGLSGGLITNAAAAFCFLWQYKNLVPIWGIQRMSELKEFLQLVKNVPVLDNKIQEVMEQDRQELSGSFCRACGYCLPCPADIPIPMAARMSLLLRRAPYQNFITPAWQEKMARILDCTHCGQCAARCPYSLDTPQLLKENYADYQNFIAAHT